MGTSLEASARFTNRGPIRRLHPVSDNPGVTRCSKPNTNCCAPGLSAILSAQVVDRTPIGTHLNTTINRRPGPAWIQGIVTLFGFMALAVASSSAHADEWLPIVP